MHSVVFNKPTFPVVSDLDYLSSRKSFGTDSCRWITTGHGWTQPMCQSTGKEPLL